MTKWVALSILTFFAFVYGGAFLFDWLDEEIPHVWLLTCFALWVATGCATIAACLWRIRD